MVGTSSESVPEMAIDLWLLNIPFFYWLDIIRYNIVSPIRIPIRSHKLPMETLWKPLGNPCLGAFLEAQSHLRSARLRDEATPVVQPRHGHGEGQAAQAARHLCCTQHLEDLAGDDSLVSCHS